MAARVPEGAPWAKLQMDYPVFGCRDAETINWSAKNNQDVQNPEYERLFRAGMAKAGFKVAGDPDNLFQEDDKSADLQVGALVTQVSATFCAGQTFWEANAHSKHFEIKGSATIGLQWQVYSTAQAKILARIPTTASLSSDAFTDQGDQTILHGAFAANVEALTQSPAFREALSVPMTSTPSASADGHPVIDFSPAPSTAARAIKDARLSVATLFARSSMGSGFLISRDGYLLTNRHVVGEATEVRVRWPDGVQSTGHVLRSNRRRDVAVIKTTPATERRCPFARIQRIPARRCSRSGRRWRRNSKTRSPRGSSPQAACTRGFHSSKATSRWITAIPEAPCSTSTPGWWRSRSGATFRTGSPIISTSSSRSVMS